MKRIKKFAKEQCRNEEGAVALLVAFLMIIMLGCAAFALDYGTVYLKKAELQNAVDIAARATSKILVDGSLDGKNDNDKDAILTQKAKYYLKENGFPENKLAKCKIVADVNSGISIDADYDVKMNFARIFDVNSVKVSAATNAVTDVNVIEGKKMTADVVFILDISGSMYWWNGRNEDKSKERFIPMVDTVNKAIATLTKDNPDNRISVVVFGGPEMNHQKVITKLTKNPGEITYKLEKQYDASHTRTGTRVIIRGKDDYVDQIQAATYTQMGMYLGCKELYDADFAEDDADTEHEVKRTPAVFLLSDGEANWGNTNYSGDLKSLGTNVGYGGSNYGRGSDANYAEAGYYSILTAIYWKAKLKEKYSQRNNEETNPIFYTMGFRLNTNADRLEYERAVLNPDSLPANPRYGIGKELKKLLNGWSNPYRNNYKYNDKYYEAYSSNALEIGLEEFASNVIDATRNYNTRLTK